MILRGADAARFLARPDPARPGFLIHGADPMRVALKRQDAILALIGPAGEGEMRLSRLSGGDLRRDTALLADAIKEVGFFPGPRVAFVEEATDGTAEAIGHALQSWAPGDATIVVTAGTLTPKSALRVLFEKHPAAVAVAIYDDPPSREQIEAELARAGLARLAPGASAALTDLAQVLDPGDFRQTLQKIATYKWQDDAPLSAEEVALNAPAATEAKTDQLTHAVAERDPAGIGPLLRRLEGQGEGAVSICLSTLRHFRALLAAKVDAGGVQAGLNKARAFGARRDHMQRQVGAWQVRQLEAAIAELIETDLTLRSASKAPQMALVERSLIRIAMTKPAGR